MSRRDEPAIVGPVAPSIFRSSPPFEHAHRCQSTLRALRGGNRTGLSAWGAREAWLHATLTHPHRDVQVHSGIGLVLAYGCAEETIRRLRETAIRKELEDDRLDRAERCLRLKNGNRIQLFLVDGASPSRLDGYRYDWVWCDGLPIGASLDTAMFHCHGDTAPAWLTFTPIGHPAAVKALRIRMEGDAKKQLAPREAWTQHIIQIPPWACPWRDLESIQQQIASYPRHEVAQRVFAMWENTSKEDE